MEIQSGATPPQARKLQLDEEALASRLVELIGGGGGDVWVPRNSEEPGDKETFSVEEGDDSVFYSDEEQVAKDAKVCDLGGNVCTPVGSGEDGVLCKDVSEVREEEVTDQEERSGPENQSDPAESESTGVSATSCEDPTTQPEQMTSSSSGTVNLPGKEEEEEEEEEVPSVEEHVETQTANMDSSVEFDDEEGKRVNVEVEEQEETPGDELQICGNSEEQEPEPEPDLDLDSHDPAALHRGLGSGYSTLPNKPSQKSFNHLTTSKYGTVSYRKIRRGNTRQKIQEFEGLFMNL